MDFAPAAHGQWASLGRRRCEAMLFKQYSRRGRLWIREEDDVEEKAEEVVRKDAGDFCWSLSFTPEFLERLFTSGFLPICTDVGDNPEDPLFVLLPKLHRRRSVVRAPLTLHVDRGARKRSRNYRVTVDAALSDVMDGCIAQHGESWLFPPMRRSLTALHGQTAVALGGSARATLHSIEVWRKDGQLVAGELGTACGAMYTSLTGFFREDGAGTVQMLALGGLLLRGGFRCWDLGMAMSYKAQLGAVELDRREFVALHRSLREDATARMPCALLPEGVLAAELVSEVVRAKAEEAEGAPAADADGAPAAKRPATEAPGAVL